MLLQRALPPGLELLLEILVKATDGASARGHSHQSLGHFPHLVGAHPCHEHLGQTLGYLWGVSAVALKDLGVELALAISGHLQILDPTRSRQQVAGVGAVAIAIAARASLPPRPCEGRLSPVRVHTAGTSAAQAVLEPSAPALSQAGEVWYPSYDVQA
jgi:hypothetical protein